MCEGLFMLGCQKDELMHIIDNTLDVVNMLDRETFFLETAKA